MNKKIKIRLFSFAALAVTGVVGGVTTGVLSNQNPITPNANKVSNSIQNGVQSKSYSLQTKFNEATQSYKITVLNGDAESGYLQLLDLSKLGNGNNITKLNESDIKKGIVDSLNQTSGGTVYVVVFTEYGMTARDLKVYGADKSISLGSKKVELISKLSVDGYDVNLFSFQLPVKVQVVDENNKHDPSSNPMQEPGFPVDSEGHITVTTTYVKEQVSLWKWDYNKKSYVLDLKKDIELDDSDLGVNIAQVVDNGDVQTYKNDTILFTILLNGHHVDVGTYTVPHGVTLFLDKGISQDNETVVIKLAKNNGDNYGFVLEGVFGVNQGIKVDAPVYSVEDWLGFYQHFLNGDYNFNKTKKSSK